MGSDVGQIFPTASLHRDHSILYALVYEKRKFRTAFCLWNSLSWAISLRARKYFPVIQVKTILSVIDIVIYRINTVEQNIAFKTDGL